MLAVVRIHCEVPTACFYHAGRKSNFLPLVSNIFIFRENICFFTAVFYVQDDYYERDTYLAALPLSTLHKVSSLASGSLLLVHAPWMGRVPKLIA
jgi:hypothetical protein